MVFEQFQVDTDLLRRDTSELKQNLQEILKIHYELEHMLESISGMWSGPAKEAFHAQFVRDLGDFQLFCQVLSEIFDNLDTAAKEYDAYDSRVRSVVDAIKI